jgi:hypothetical protein
MKLRPKNWRDFQHYKNRNPPWIRLHRSLLDNRDFHCLPVASKALAPLLWLLASESVEGLIDASADNLCFRLRMSEKDLNAAIRPLIDKGFFDVVQEASEMLADGLRDADSETEERQRQSAACAASASPALTPNPEDPPEGLDLTAWGRWLEYRKGIKKPIKGPSVAAAQRDMAKLAGRQAEAVEFTIAKGWTGLREPDRPKNPEKPASGIPTFRPGNA